MASLFRTKQTVTREISTTPYVGFENSTDLPEGWLYDIKRWSSPFDLKLPYLPRLADPSRQGVSETTYFASGVGDVQLGDLWVKKIDTFIENYERHWIPIVEHGHYFRHATSFFYYGDNSRVQYVNSVENRDSRNYIELDYEPQTTIPILAAIFNRHPDTSAISYDKRIEQRQCFTGVYVDEEEQETVSELGKITWDNVDTTKREFIVDRTIEGITRLFFNRDYNESYGVVPEVYQDLNACEFLDISTGASYQTMYLKRFPILADESFHLYSATTTTWEEWTRVDSWWDLITTDYSYATRNRFFLDKDLGIIYFGANTNGGVPSIDELVYAAYTTTPRIEYEEMDRSTEIEAWDADTNPITQGNHQGFVCITHEQLVPASITLAIDKSPIQGVVDPKEYGPIIIGTDYGILKGTVLSPSGVPVPNTEVGFTMTPTTIGYLNGSSSSSSVTGYSGLAYSSYQPPVSANDLGFYSTTVRASTSPYYPTSKEIILKVNETGLEGQEESIYLYQILKDDVLLGYSTLDSFLESLYQEDTPTWVTDATTYAKWKEEMVNEWDLQDWVEPVEGFPISGRKVVIYQIDDNNVYDYSAINPVTGEAGAVIPLRPSLAEQITDTGDAYYGMWRLIYPSGAIPDCGPSEPVGGYWAASDRLVTFQAHCWSPHYNRVIYSNEIVARITLPPYLLGEYLNQLGEKIPFGWKVLSDSDNIAAGIDGATFITINPHSGPHEILDLVAGGTTDEWADAPVRTIGFQFGLGDGWIASTAYSVNDYVLSSVDEDLYQCTTAGTSGLVEPTWNIDVGDTTTDNTVVWTRV